MQHRIAELVRQELDAQEEELTPYERAAIAESDAEFAAGAYMDFDDYVRERRARERHP